MGKILVCDDDQGILKILKKTLELEGHEIIAALSGKECIEKAKDTKPDFIFLDIMMPHMNGWETLEELKKNEEIKHIPVSMLTVKHLPAEKFNKKKMEELVVKHNYAFSNSISV